MSDRIMIIVYDNDTYEELKGNEKKLISDVAYWIRRRIEKEGKYPVKIWIADKTIALEPIMVKIEKQEMDERARLVEATEIEELKRLKEKYNQ